MTVLSLLEAAGWACALAALCVLAVVRWRTGARLALVAEASHELRGPLTVVSLGLATLARDAEPERARRAAVLDLELRRAGLALDDLAAAPSGRRAPDCAGIVDVADLLDEVRDAWSPLAAAFGTRIEVVRPAEWWAVRADRVRLAQAVGNLVGNALEHGEGPVTLAAGPVAAVSGRLGVEVRDRGPGLPPGALARAGAAHASRRGHGLGVAARVAERSGGRLVSEERPAEHVMVLELPLAQPRPVPLARVA